MTPKRDQTIITESKLRSIYDKPSDRAIAKELNHLDQYCQEFIKLSPFVLLATTDRKGRIDVSPRGGAPGFVHCADDHTLYLPDRRGNNRLDSLTNIIQTTNVGLLFLVPGFIECVRVAGSAQICEAADFVALARPHLTNPHFTLQAAAFYGVKQQRWPIPYETGKEQSYRLAQRDRAQELVLRKAARPSSHLPYSV